MAVFTYAERYETTRIAAVDWPTWRLSYTLWFLIRSGQDAESEWGAIDAMADLILERGETEQPPAP